MQILCSNTDPDIVAQADIWVQTHTLVSLLHQHNVISFTENTIFFLMVYYSTLFSVTPCPCMDPEQFLPNQTDQKFYIIFNYSNKKCHQHNVISFNSEVLYIYAVIFQHRSEPLMHYPSQILLIFR